MHFDLVQCWWFDLEQIACVSVCVLTCVCEHCTCKCGRVCVCVLSTAVCFFPQSVSVVAYLALNAGSPPPVACDIGSWHPHVYSKCRRHSPLQKRLSLADEEVFVLPSLLGNCPQFSLSGSRPHWKHRPVHSRCLFCVDFALLRLEHKNRILMEAVVHMRHFAAKTVLCELHQQQALPHNHLFYEIFIKLYWF